MFKSLFFFLLVIACLSCRENCLEVDVPYVENIPYEDIEKFYEMPNYSVLESVYQKKFECYKENLWGKCVEKKWYITTLTTIENIDSIVLKATLFQRFNTYHDGDVELKKKVVIPPNGKRTVELKHHLLDEFQSFSKPVYDVLAEKAEKKRKVTKYKNVTKYRKCNTCIEDCKKILKKKTKSSIWPKIVFCILILGVIGNYLEKKGIIK